MRTVQEIRDDNKRFLHDAMSLKPEAMMNVIMALAGDRDTLLRHYDALKLQELGALNTVAALLSAEEVQELVDEIETLKAENTRLRAALQPLADLDTKRASVMKVVNLVISLQPQAREALKGDTE